MNILFILPDRTDATSWYRSGGITHDLFNKTGHSIKIVQLNETIVQWQMISDCDMVFMQRPFTKISVDLGNFIKTLNKPIWCDYDDNVFAVNPENSTHDIYNDPDTQGYVKSMLAMADVVSVPLEYLRQVYLPFNKNIWVIPNAFNDTLLKRCELKPRTKTAAWRGPSAHIYDLMTYGREINRAAREFEDWQFLFIGYRPWFFEVTNNKDYMPPMDIVIYFHKLVDLAPSFLYIPLHDNAFNRCRSNTAAIEAAFAGAVSIVPDWWNMPGTLPYSDTESYYEAMRSVLSGEVDIVSQNNLCWEYIQDCLLLSKVNQERVNLINSLKT